MLDNNEVATDRPINSSSKDRWKKFVSGVVPSLRVANGGVIHSDKDRGKTNASATVFGVVTKRTGQLETDDARRSFNERNHKTKRDGSHLMNNETLRTNYFKDSVSLPTMGFLAKHKPSVSTEGTLIETLEMTTISPAVKKEGDNGFAGNLGMAVNKVCINFIGKVF